ncbi:hypothetical protein QTP88_020086 [Uroleucon formosanum]
MPQQPALHWNYTNPITPSVTFRAFSDQQFYQQTTPQHYPSTSQVPIRNIFDNPITPQENSLHSLESSAKVGLTRSKRMKIMKPWKRMATMLLLMAMLFTKLS